MSLKTIPISKIFPKLTVIAVCFGLSALFLVFAKWSFGNSISLYVVENSLAEFAVSLAPSDPQTHFSLGFVNEQTFLEDDFQKSLEAYRSALSLSPQDYRFWLALAKALERSGDSEGAEVAFKRTLDLAPNYSHVNWAYGNFLLRQGKSAEAFVEIKKAAESNKTFLQPAVSIAWQFYQGNLAEVRQLFERSPELNSMLALFLANEKRFDEAIEIWNTIPAEEKTANFKDSGNQLFQKLIGAKRFGDALMVYSEIEPDESKKFSEEKIANGGFENDVKPEKADIFDWQLGAGLQPQILFDEAKKFEGTRSLVVAFDSSDGKEFRSLSQMVVVEPDKQYTISLAYRSKLETSASFGWEVVDAEGKVISVTEPLENQTDDWKRVSMDFTTPKTGDAIVIRLARLSCPSAICRIKGNIWFDDFQIKL